MPRACAGLALDYRLVGWRLDDRDAEVPDPGGHAARPGHPAHLHHPGEGFQQRPPNRRHSGAAVHRNPPEQRFRMVKARERRCDEIPGRRSEGGKCRRTSASMRPTACSRERAAASSAVEIWARSRPAVQALLNVAAAAREKPGRPLMLLSSPRSAVTALAIAAFSASESTGCKKPPARRAARCSIDSACRPCRRATAASPRARRHARRKWITIVSRTSPRHG
jgi:hypothetical protein